MCAAITEATLWLPNGFCYFVLQIVSVYGLTVRLQAHITTAHHGNVMLGIRLRRKPFGAQESLFTWRHLLFAPHSAGFVVAHCFT